MSKVILLIVIFIFCGCNIRESLDLGSAAAIKELQVKHNEHIPIIQGNSKHIRSLSNTLVEQNPKVYGYKKTLMESERVYQTALNLTKATADPYSQVGVIIKWLERLEWLFSPEGLAMLASIFLGGGGCVVGVRGVKKAGRAVTQLNKVAKMNPNEVKDSDLYI